MECKCVDPRRAAAPMQRIEKRALVVCVGHEAVRKMPPPALLKLLKELPLKHPIM